VTGSQIKSATASLSQAGQWTVNINFNGPGGTAWDTLAQHQFHAIIGIDLDGQVISAPITQPGQTSFTSFGGQVQISGSFTEDQAKALATELNYGALPVKLDQQTVQTVSPSLGKSSLQAGLISGLIGLLLVMLYTIFYYRLLGLVVVAGLAVTGALLWSIIAWMGQAFNTTIDLAGVIGIIVSVGITVDSYIVYFERLKDEARSGRTVRTSVDRGFKSAFRTVLAADFVSLLGALVLYKFSIGPVQGFALFLGLSTVLDVAVTYFFTRPFVILLGRSRGATEAKGMGVASGLGMQEKVSV
jgi:preprotein translocase subunit SecD